MIGRGETPMLERALPLSHQEIVHGEDHRARQSVSISARLHDLIERLAHILRAVGAFFAAGGALS
jgi:hypothetical protein